MLIETGYVCAVCGEWNDATVDASAGEHQAYTEDCQVCCNPNFLRITIDRETEAAHIDASFEE
ncbi:MAG: CPXCG motif-containing cysteine-rich protein [Rhizobacter sp.]|nr:CPXCG motif-containing cysteine-rich protein [Chlorobiales bacterium]